MDSNNNETIELWDAESDSTFNFSMDELKNLSQIITMLSSIKMKVNQHEVINGTNKHYEHWIERGWNKSLEYYLASRSKTYDVSRYNEPFLLERKNIPIRITPNDDHIQSILKRRTRRSFQEQTLDYDIFYNSFLKIIAEIGCSTNFNFFSFYFIVYNISELQPGVYYYDIKKNAFFKVKEGRFEDYVCECLNGLAAPKTAVFTVIQVANFKESMQKAPHAKGLRNTFMDAGRIAQKLIIEYGRYGLACLPTPALLDRKICSLISISESECAPIYSQTFGFPKK